MAMDSLIKDVGYAVRSLRKNLGFAGALAIAGLMRSMLIAVKPTDHATFAMITVRFFAIAALASWLPARRAPHLDPSGRVAR